MPLGSLPQGGLQKGYTLVGVLLLLALCMLGLSVAGPMWSDQVKREREQDLLRIGALYAQAILQYKNMSPGTLKQYPKELNELLLDLRISGVNRHIRQLYSDPVNPRQPWGLIRDNDGRIKGIYSLSQEAPIARGPLRIGGISLDPAKKYADWQFIAQNQP